LECFKSQNAATDAEMPGPTCHKTRTVPTCISYFSIPSVYTTVQWCNFNNLSVCQLQNRTFYFSDDNGQNRRQRNESSGHQGQQWWQHNRAGASVPSSCGEWRTFRSRRNHHTTCTYSHSLALSIHPTLPSVAPRATGFISQLRGATVMHIDGTFTHVCSLWAWSQRFDIGRTGRMFII